MPNYRTSIDSIKGYLSVVRENEWTIDRYEFVVRLQSDKTCQSCSFVANNWSNVQNALEVEEPCQCCLIAEQLQLTKTLRP